MHSRAKKYLIRLMLVAIVVATSSVPSASGQSAPGGAVSQEEKNRLQQELTDIENQIAAYQKELASITGEKKTLQNKINYLKKQQASLNLQIRATALQIDSLGQEINKTENEIGVNTQKARELKEKIAKFLALAYENDETPLLHVVLSHDSLSGILSELAIYSEVTERLNTLLEQTRETTEQLTADQARLEAQEEDARSLLSLQSQQKQELLGAEGEHNSLLDQTKGKESEYQAVLGTSQKQAAEIRNRLYQLIGVSTQITFGQAVEIAKYASSMTGVRASFLLAILTQESNLGKNVGTCNRAGDPPEKSWKVVMKPGRDQEPFKTITAELGMDIETTPVSCPMKDSRGRQVGWGGAMGPAQFIPSTWMGYKDKIAAVTGKMANPWDIRDAFIASAIKLKAGGAGTVEGEWAAAMRYFSGGTNKKYRFYGDNVVKMANQYQSEIEALGQ